MVCNACEGRGKTWEGDDPKCAFETDTFDRNNWNCATVGLIRRICDESQRGVNYQQCEDQNYTTVTVNHIEGLNGALALWVSWYKRRGRTDAMWLLFENDPPREPTEQECMLIAAAYGFNKQ